MKVFLSIMLALIASMIILYGVWERDAEIRMIQNTRKIIFRQQILITKLIEQSRKMEAISSVLHDIFLYNLQTGNKAQQNFQECMNLANRNAKNQVKIINIILNTKKIPTDDKMLRFWLSGARELAYQTNISILEDMRFVLIPWYFAARDVAEYKFGI